MKLKGYMKKGSIRKKSLPVLPEKESSRKDFKVNTVHGNSGYVPPKSQRGGVSTAYKNFLEKYSDLDNYIDSLNTQELLFYFREVANENGYKYMLNFSKEGSQMKRLMQTYDNREICGMIEFLFNSEQDYLPKNRLSIGLLCSSWVNTIYADFNLWLEDKYFPRSSSKRKDSTKHEWKDREIKSSVGEW